MVPQSRVLPTHSYNAAPVFICTPLWLQAPRLKSYRRLGISRFVGMLAYENEMVLLALCRMTPPVRWGVIG